MGVKQIHKIQKNILWLKYEWFINDFDLIFNEFENFFKIKIPKEKRESLKKKYSKKNVSKILEKKEKNEPDTTNLFWKNHITSYQNELRWKKEIKKSSQRIIYFLLRKDLLRFGYGI